MHEKLAFYDIKCVAIAKQPSKLWQHALWKHLMVVLSFGDLEYATSSFQKDKLFSALGLPEDHPTLT